MVNNVKTRRALQACYILKGSVLTNKEKIFKQGRTVRIKFKIKIMLIVHINKIQNFQKP